MAQKQKNCVEDLRAQVEVNKVNTENCWPFVP